MRHQRWAQSYETASWARRVAVVSVRVVSERRLGVHDRLTGRRHIPGQDGSHRGALVGPSSQATGQRAGG